jgi:2'-5' RNA ligase
MARESAIDIHLESLEALIAPWRQATVEVAVKGVPPHITLLYPWRVAPLSEEDAREVQKVLEQYPSFEIQLAKVSHFGKRVIYLALNERSEKAVKELMQVLFRAFPETPPYGGAFSDPTPHLTIAKAKDDETFEQMMAEITRVLAPKLPIKHQVSGVSVIEEAEDGYWHLRALVPFADP